MWTSRTTCRECPDETDLVGMIAGDDFFQSALLRPCISPQEQNHAAARVADQENERMVGFEFLGFDRLLDGQRADNDARCGGRFGSLFINVDKRLMNHRRDEQISLAIHSRKIGVAREGQGHAHGGQRRGEADFLSGVEFWEPDSDILAAARL